MSYLIDQVKRQGLSFVMLLVFSYFSYEKWNTCNETLIEIYREERIEMMRVIEDNTKAFEILKPFPCQ
ncbi:MAG: hypothetical protein AAFW73_26340 [Bacteroidota bacterium]